MTKKICSIVGMGPGLGMALGHKFGAAGYHIGMFARDSRRLKEYGTVLAQHGINSSGIEADAGNSASLKEGFRQLRDEGLLTEVLIYNAFGLTPGKPTELSDESLVRDFRVNVVGALVASQMVAAEMVSNKKGTLLFTGGGFALYPMSVMASLGVGKAGLRNLTMSLAAELEPKGLRVGTVTIMGMIKDGTPFSPAAIAQALYALHVQQPGEPNELFFTEQGAQSTLGGS